MCSNERLGEDACGETIIEAHGTAHHIRFSVDHIKQEPKIQYTTKRSRVVDGTRVKVQLPNYGEDDLLEYAKDRFLKLAESYAWLNPHLTLRLSWNGEQVLNIRASNPGWRKWLPTWPTSAHWYDKSRFRRYMAAHIANRGSITVREFISEFRGMTATAKQKLVLAETGASHVSLHNYFGLHKANIANIAKLLASIQQHTKPVKAAELGIIGKEHLYRMMEIAGGDPKTFTYNRIAWRDQRHSPGDRICFRHSPRRACCWRASTVAENYHRRELVTRDQQSIPATRAGRRWSRRDPVGSPRQHFTTRHRCAASRLSTRGVHGPRQVRDCGRR